MDSLKHLHTFGLDAQAKQLVSITHIEQVSDLPRPLWLLGQGSNCLFVDDFDGTVAQVALNGVDVKENSKGYTVSAAAGENWHKLVEFCLAQGIYGFENLALIPGTVGAAPIQNIGAYGVEVKRFIESVEYIELDSGQQRSLASHDCRFGYRDSIFKHELCGKVLISKVHFFLPKAWQPVTQYAELAQLSQPSAQQIFDMVVSVRQSKLPDPDVIGNAGSFFKNPLVNTNHLASLHCDWPDMPFYKVDQNSVKVPAAWLIDRLGFKGKKLGGIACHASQPLVLTNDGSGTAEQVLTLARDIQSQVKATFSIALENEVRLIGKHGSITL